MDSDKLQHIITVWEKTVDMQMHFNEMCLEIRKTAITVVGVLLGAAALAFRFGGQVLVNQKSLSVAVVFVSIALFVWVAFYLMDRFWYHELLRAAVHYAETMEDPAHNAGLGIPLDVSKKIREANHKALKLSGGNKVHLFYGLVGIGLLIALSLLATGYIQPIKA